MHKRLPANILWRSLSLSERVDWIRRSARVASTPTSGEPASVARLSATVGAKAYADWISWGRLHRIRSAERDAASQPCPPTRRPPTGPAEWESFAVAALNRLGTKRRTSSTPALEVLLHPFFDEAISRIRAQVTDPRHASADLVAPAFFEQLEQSMYESFFGVAASVLILEVNLARLRGRLKGEKSADRFRDFIDRMLSSPTRLRRLYLSYPVLVRALSTITLNFAEHVNRIFSCYVADRRDVARLMSVDDPGPITRFHFGGDAHNSGRRVTIITFQSGAALVFKPRSLARDDAFQRLIGWVNQRGFAPPLSRATTLPRQDYGWSAFLEATPATDREAVGRFYTRVGGLIALLRSIRGSDIHFENIIASGEDPLVVDLEALLGNRLAYATRDEQASLPNSPAARVVHDSVFEVGILPSRSRQENNPDFSALGKNEDTSLMRPTMANPFSDDVRIELGPLRIGHTPNLPVVDGHEVTVTGFESELMAGFDRMYAVLSEHKNELVDPRGPLHELLQTPSRVVLTATRMYALIQSRSWHPDYLRDGLAQECILVSSLRALSRSRRRRAHLVMAEYEALAGGDMPKFLSSPLSRDIWTADRRPIRYFDSDAWTKCRQQIDSLGETDHRLQRDLIAFSLTMLNRTERHSLQQPPAAKLSGRIHPASPERYLDEASRIGERLCEQAFIEGGVADWITPVALSHDPRDLRIGAAGPDLYHGTAGIALFLVHLSMIRPTRRLREVADAAMEFCRRWLASRRSELNRRGGAVNGAFSGTASTSYGLLRCSVVLDRPELTDECLRNILIDMRASVAHFTQGTASTPQLLDIIGGAAGLIQVGLACADVTGSREVVALATELGSQILARRESRSIGCGWPSTIDSTDLMTGLAHGTAGIAWSLRLLGTATGDTRFTDCAHQAINYERALFLPDACAWPDFRQIPGATRTELSWCWGAPGVGLSRVAVNDHLDARDVSEIQFIVEKMLEAPLSGSDCLCHGELGNLELPILASQRLRREDWRLAAIERAERVLDRTQLNGDWIDGVGTVVHRAAPGLMLGLAGIGFQLLRLAVPDSVPSILALAGSGSRRSISPPAVVSV
jgi:type 2 lantibiotic biosynthesis protein LanM